MPTTADRLPCDPTRLAVLMYEQEQNLTPGEPDPSIAIWEQLQQQEGYDVAARLWRDACSYYDHMFAGDTDDDA